MHPTLGDAFRVLRPSAQKLSSATMLGSPACIHVSPSGSPILGKLTSMLCTAWVAGLIQTATYADFFYYYIKAWRNNEKLALPV